MSVNAEGLNAKTLLCPNANCKCVLLKPAHAKFENIEKDHVRRLQIFVRFDI